MDAALIHALPGAVFGIIGGMGLGGGIVLIPVLTLFMGKTQLAAQGMTLFAYLPMAACALCLHIRGKKVKAAPAASITLFGCAGGAAGYFLAFIIGGDILRAVFATFLILTALLRVWRHELCKKARHNATRRQKQ